MSVTYVNRVVKGTAEKAGIERNVWTYLIRHTFLTELEIRGVTGIVHNKAAGHKPGSRMQGVYVHLNNDDVKNAIRDKMYKVQELTPDQKTKYDQEIAELKGQLASVMELLKEFRSLVVAGPKTN